MEKVGQTFLEMVFMEACLLREIIVTRDFQGTIVDNLCLIPAMNSGSQIRNPLDFNQGKDNPLHVDKSPHGVEVLV